MQFEVGRLKSQQDVDELNKMIEATIVADEGRISLIRGYIDFSKISFPKDVDRVFIARYLNEIVGAVQYDSTSSPATIDQIYVRPKLRRHGIGRQLLAEVEKEVASLEKEKIEVQAGIFSGIFYNECGYKLVDEGRDLREKVLK